MEILVLMAQRKESYPGEYGMEALAVMSEYDYESNPEYLHDAKRENAETGDFSALDIVTLEVSEPAIKAILFPAATKLPATVVEP